MKMPEKHDLLAAILAAKEQGLSGQSLRFVWPSRQIWRCVYKNGNRRNDVRHYRLVHS